MNVNDPIERVRRRQKLNVLPDTKELLQHKPTVFYIGCSDARVDPLDHIGLELGDAFIHRNTGAVVTPGDHQLGGALEFFFRHLNEGKKDLWLVVSAHTHCGATETSLKGVDPGG